MTPEDPVRARWYHVGRPWADRPGLIYAGDEDPHAGTYLFDCGDWSDELHFGETQAIDVGALADLIVKEHNAALAASPAPAPALDDLGMAWAAAEAAVEAMGGWFTVTSNEEDRSLYTIEARRWIDPLPIEEPARIWRQPLTPALRAFAAALEGASRDERSRHEVYGHPEPVLTCPAVHRPQSGSQP